MLACQEFLSPQALGRSFQMNSTSATLLSSVLLLLPLCLASGAPVQDARPNAGFHHYLVGNPGDVVRSTSGLLVPQGGGDDVDANYVRMGEAAGGGDFVVLRASGDDDYNEYIFGLCHCDSVETIVFESREAAFDPGVVEAIRNAEAIFIGGGDQSNYVRSGKERQSRTRSTSSRPSPHPSAGPAPAWPSWASFPIRR